MIIKPQLIGKQFFMLLSLWFLHFKLMKYLEEKRKNNLASVCWMFKIYLMNVMNLECCCLEIFGLDFNASWHTSWVNHENAIKVIRSTATPLQVAAIVLIGVIWAIETPLYKLLSMSKWILKKGNHWSLYW
jgi:hypothetical protein